MDNKIEHFFVLKPDGKIYHIPDYPESFYYANDPVGWKRALQSAIDNAVEVSNQEEVEKEICDRVRAMVTNHPYPLQCSVEKKEESSYEHVYLGQARRVVKTVALVTFSQPEREETQEETYRVLLLASYCGNNDNCTENHPCPDCLQMCNVYEVPKPVILLPKCVGQFDQAITRKTP